MAPELNKDEITMIVDWLCAPPTFPGLQAKIDGFHWQFQPPRLSEASRTALLSLSLLSKDLRHQGPSRSFPTPNPFQNNVRGVFLFYRCEGFHIQALSSLHQIDLYKWRRSHRRVVRIFPGATVSSLHLVIVPPFRHDGNITRGYHFSHRHPHRSHQS